ncbi:MAG: UDP-N-acetylmuramate dehydrogenase [Candidatus Omnitrophota bacterium]|nr:MAG: UDP-N-acetylmuramate dehydrogenase [Candidatus Omnitrophota bacterium]
MSLIKIEQKHNVNLAPFTTIKIGGVAEHFFIAHTSDDLGKIIEECSGQFYLLGAGSNLLISDSFITRPVIKLGEKFCYTKYDGELLEAGAATPVSSVINYTLRRSLSGLEGFAGIPATVGGLVAMNASAFGSDVSSSLVKLQVMDYNANLKVLEREEIKFDYRQSSVKNSMVILRAWFGLNPEADLRSKIDSFLKTRYATQDFEFPSCGCIFKNPPSNAAGFLIESCGLKGLRCNDARVSLKHANFIVNLGKARYQDVDSLIQTVKEKVYNTHQIKLLEEIERWT